MEITEFFTWEYLATFAGCMVATGLVTQAIKGIIDKVVCIPTQLLAWIVAIIILVLAGAFTGSLTVSNAVLCIFNGLIVAAGTSGTVSLGRRLTEGKAA